MNVTELARKLKMTTSELFDALPQLGFDIGRRAIKINDAVANKIISNWPKYRRQLEIIKAKASTAEVSDDKPAETKTVKIPEAVVVRNFASLAGLNVSKVLGELMKNGIFVSMNEKIDFDTAVIIGGDLNLEVVLDAADGGGAENADKIKEVLAKQKESLLSRPPVIVIMGHVDHGKTKLLDTIRKTNVIDKEAGGITQHIGAYQIERNGKILTFIDTPGHEVFTAMRSRGAKAADIAVLVVAADDGVKPQTVEAYRIIEQSKLPFIVAINKIDKEGADVEKTKNELSSKLRIVPDEWGGKTICVPISAKEGDGIDTLLDNVLLVSEIETNNIVANKNAPAAGTVIESHIDKGEGPVATILIQNGTLRSGDIICLNNSPLGKVRVMKDYKSDVIEKAEPSTPVCIAGLKVAPNIGDIVEVYDEDKRLRLGKLKKSHDSYRQSAVKDEADSDKIKAVNVIIKSDVLGSAEAIEESLEKLNTDNVKVRVLKKGLGNITESDIDRALASGAVILGFNTSAPANVASLARDKEVEIKIYKIIYELVDYIKAKVRSLMADEIVHSDLGRLKVLAVFKTTNEGQVIGGRVEEGHIELGSKAEVARGGRALFKGEVINIQSGKQNVNRVDAGEECGLHFKGGGAVEKNDILKLYKEDANAPKL